MFRYILALGSNESVGSNTLEMNMCNAIAFLCETTTNNLTKSNVKLIRRSNSIQTLPLVHSTLETTKQADYLNCLIEVVTLMNPDDLYAKIVTLEDFMGHNRLLRWAPRVMDIDVILFGYDTGGFLEKWQTWNSGTITCPHPELKNRDFLIVLLRNWNIYYPE